MTNTIEKHTRLKKTTPNPVTKNSVCFLMPAVGQPRWAKRVSMLKEEGFHVQALCFERDYHQGRLPDCSIYSLGQIEKGRYLKRLLIMGSVLPVIRKKTVNNDVIYAFGLDLALLSFIANVFRQKHIVLEVGDIRAIQVKAGLVGKLMQRLSQWIYKRVSLLVVTSEDFVSGYYSYSDVNQTPYIVIENKQEKASDDSYRAVTETINPQSSTVTDVALSKVIRIGYFGLLRSPWSYLTLARYAADNSETVKIVVAGALHEGHTEFEELLTLDNVEYLGPYRSPDDLINLYSQVDLVWGCYPDPPPSNQTPNEAWSWARAVCRSNRFYESCFYNVPIISMAHSKDGKVVEQHGVGAVLESYDYDVIKEKLDSISSEKLAIWKQNITNLPEHIHSYTDESQRLAKAIRNSNKSGLIL